MKTGQIAEEAARWLTELKDADRGRQQEFLAWLRESPRHVEEFLFATTVWQRLQRFGEEEKRRVEELIALASAQDSNVVAMPPLTPAPLPQGERGKRRNGFALAASVLIAAIALAGWQLTRTPAYSTAIGEQRSVRLEDGSVVYLNTKSRMQVRYSARGRDIRLLDGEALFVVQRDSARPFRVEAGDNMIQAIGTQFNVYRRAAGTTVSVIEGAVKVDELPLVAGEEARIATNGRVMKRPAPDIDKAVAWRERRLVFRADRLEDVVTEVNRYSPKPIRIEGDAARNLRLTAIFDADDPQSLVRFLEKLDGLAIERAGDTITVRPASPRTSPPR